MTKAFSRLAVVALLSALVACGGGKDESDDPDVQKATAQASGLLSVDDGGKATIQPVTCNVNPTACE